MTGSEILSRPRLETEGHPLIDDEDSPDELVESLAPYAGDKYYDIAGLHLYTFNQVEGTEQWRQGMLGPKKASGAGALR